MAMPVEIRETYSLLSKQLIKIQCRWTIYRQLFGTNADRITLLNRFAAVAFGMIQRTMEDDTVIALARLSDDAAWGKGKRQRHNCSLERLVNLVSADSPALATKLGGLLAKIDQIRDNCMDDLRNRTLAHADLETLADMAAGLAGPNRPSRANIESLLTAAAEVLNEVQKHYEQTDTHYGRLNLPGGADGEFLVGWLGELAGVVDADGGEMKWRLNQALKQSRAREDLKGYDR
jgi:hypothetical protein